MARLAGRGSRTFAAALAAALAVVAVAALVLARGGDDRTAAGAPATRPSAADPGIAGNQVTLGAAESLRLVRWAARLHACLRARGLQMSRPVATRREIAMRPQGSAPAAEVLAGLSDCGARLGDPPRGSSLQLVRDGRVVLYVPKQCLLDAGVAAKVAA